LFFVFLLIFLLGCIAKPEKETEQRSLEQLKYLFGACESEYNSLLKIVDDESKTPLEKAEECKNKGKSIEICLEKMFDFEEESLSAEASDYFENVKYDLLNLGLPISNACACAETAKYYDSKIWNEQYLSGKQLLRIEKLCRMREECKNTIEENGLSEAAANSVRGLKDFAKETPLNFHIKSITKDFVDYCTALVEEAEAEMTNASGEEKEALEIKWAEKVLYCNGKANFGGFFEENTPEWLIILGRGKNQDAANAIEKYAEKYEITFSGDEFNCPSTPFKLGLRKKTGIGKTDSKANCSRAALDSCAAGGGTMDASCECKKTEPVNCTQFCSALGREAIDSEKANLVDSCKKEGNVPKLCPLLPIMAGKSFNISVFIDKEAGCCCKLVSSAYSSSNEGCWEIGSPSQHSDSTTTEYWTFSYSSLPCNVAEQKIVLADCNN